jgi:hypothetical protein
VEHLVADVSCGRGVVPRFQFAPAPSEPFDEADGAVAGGQAHGFADGRRAAVDVRLFSVEVADAEVERREREVADERAVDTGKGAFRRRNALVGLAELEVADTFGTGELAGAEEVGVGIGAVVDAGDAAWACSIARPVARSWQSMA